VPLMGSAGGGSGLRGGSQVAAREEADGDPKVYALLVSNRSPPWSLRVRRPTRGEDQCPVLT